MQGRECGKGMSKPQAGLQSLGQGSRKRVWDGVGRGGSSMQSSENRTKVCGWMGYVVGVKCWNSDSMGMRGYIKEGLELAPMGPFDVEQGG